MDRERGFTLIETLIGLLILTFILTTSLAIFFERQRRLRDADEMIVVWQALSNEAEVVRLASYSSLQPGHPRPFSSETSILSTLAGVETEVEVNQWKPGVKLVQLTVRWKQKKRQARLEVVRASTPGGTFW